MNRKCIYTPPRDALDVSYVIERSYRICLTYVVNIHVMLCFNIILNSCLNYAQGFSCAYKHACFDCQFNFFSPSKKNVNSDFVQMSASTKAINLFLLFIPSYFSFFVLLCIIYISLECELAS